MENFETDSLFKRSICEVLLDQRYFNGIGNYLRAEILHRAQISPFVAAIEALKGPNADLLLDLCRSVPKYVMDMGFGIYANGEYLRESFYQWMQCYMKPGMKNFRTTINVRFGSVGRLDLWPPQVINKYYGGGGESILQ